MFNLTNLEQEKEKQELKIENLILDFERLNVTVEQFFKENGLSEESVTQFNANKDHFTDEAWDKLNEERLKLEEKLKTQLELIRNPKAAQKKYAERYIAPHWLFVR